MTRREFGELQLRGAISEWAVRNGLVVTLAAMRNDAGEHYEVAVYPSQWENPPLFRVPVREYVAESSEEYGALRETVQKRLDAYLWEWARLELRV